MVFDWEGKFINQVVCQDSLIALKEIPSATVDLIFSDPPFNLGKDYGATSDDSLDEEVYRKWCEEWVSECCRILKDSGSIYIMNIQEKIWYFQKILDDKGFKFRNTIVWKNSSLPVKNRFCVNYQPIIYYTKSNNYMFDYKAESHISSAALPWGRANNGNLMIDQWNDIPFISGGCMASKEAILASDSKKKAHPAQMPLKLAQRVIKFSSNKGDVVLDPFVGSGTTVVAARDLERKFIGIEISPVFCEIARSRLNGDVVNINNEDGFKQLTFEMD